MRILLFLAFFLSMVIYALGQQEPLTIAEKEHVDKVKGFFDIVRKIETFGDTSSITRLTRSYLVVLSKTYDFDKIRKELRYLQGFLLQYPESGLILLPARLMLAPGYKDFTEYQQKYTLVVCSKTHPEKVLLYIMMVPAVPPKYPEARILSWQLMYTLGRYYYVDILGSKEVEKFLFDGVKPPKKPIGH